MKNIKTLVGIHPMAYQANLFGVEIEVEGKRLPTTLDPNHWRIETDGSLKAAEAYEYVTPGPLSLAGVRASLDVLEAAYKAKRTVVDESIRAGVHVHMNVQDWDIKQLMTFAVCYYLVEDLLMNYCGPDREGNLFCLRTRDAEYVLFRILRTLQERNLKHLKDDVIRYSSLNYCSLFKYGSIEFRGMRGTGNLDTIYEWVEIINELRESSLKFNAPIDVIGNMSGSGEIDFFERLFPTKHHLFNREGMAKSIRDSARRIQMIAFAVDWDRLTKPNVNIFRQDGF